MPATTLPIQETFVSVQGEGGLVGIPSSFVRVSGCNLRCTWCDSPQSSWTREHTRTTIADLIAFCKQGPRHVVLTGGEPLLFRGVAKLSQALVDAGHHVTIETAGTVWLDGLRADLLSISPKLDHSAPRSRAPQWVGRHQQRRWNPTVVARLVKTYPWQLKFVVRVDSAAAQQDMAEIDSMVDELGLDARDRVLLMPECIDPHRLTAAYHSMLSFCYTRGYRLGQRLHIELFGHTPGT